MEVGQQLLIPTNESKINTYTVKAGDTLFMGNNGYFNKKI